MSITSSVGNETKNANKILEMVNYLRNMAPGTLVTHDTLKEVMDVTNQRYYYTIMSAVKRDLIRLGVFLDSVHKEGYRVTLPGEEIKICVARTVKAFRQEIRAAHDAVHIKVANITDEGSKQRTEKLISQMTARLPFTDNQMRLLEQIVVGG